jgi:iron complex outermembrane receptor protein
MVSVRGLLSTLLVPVLVLAGALAHAQTEGRITGAVKDATAAGLPGVTVTATNLATNFSRSATTADDGGYTITGLPPGAYTVSATLFGFRKVTVPEVQVTAEAAAPADFSMETLRTEEITVTAMLREQNVQDVPFSIVAPTESDLRERGVDDIEGVAQNVAGFSVQNLGPGQSQVAMRGISAGQIARDQPGVKEQVGSYLDDSPISLSLFTPDIDLFDVGRVEVLRGPQGTLFGAGSLSGTVRYISNPPEIGRKKAFAEVDGRFLSGGSAGGSAKLGFNAPLGETAAARVVGYYTALPGYLDAVQPNQQINEDVNDGYRAGVRAAITWAPSDRFSLTPRLVYQKLDMNGWNRVDTFNILANPYTTSRPAIHLGSRQQFTQIEEPTTDEFTIADLNLRYDFGSVRLTSVTSWTSRDVLVVRDATALTASITGGSVGLPEPIYTIDAPLDDATESSVWTQEVRLSGNKEKLQWVIGAFYSDNTRDYGQSLLVSGFEAASGIPTAGRFGAGTDVLYWSDLHYELSQFAGFGEATYSLTPQWGLTAGLRYYNFNEDRTQVFDGIFADPGGAPNSVEASGVAPRLIINYKANERVSLNAQAARGFRLGGINDPLNRPLCTPADLATFDGHDTWEDETAWNYEVGAKTRIMNGRGNFNVSLFDMEVEDLQATVTAGSCSSRVIFNVPKARSRGLEVDFAATPNEHLDFTVSAGYNNAELASTLTSTAADGTVSVVSGIEEGRRLPSVPEFQMAATATYQWQLRPGSLGFVTATFQHIGSRYTQVGDETDLGSLNLLSFGANTIGAPLTQATHSYDPLLESYSLLNLRAGVVREKWEGAIYVNNVTDEEAQLSLDRERGTRARIGYVTNPPRTFGAMLRLNF